MDEPTRTILQGVSTATIATALFKRGLRHQMVQGVLPLGARRGSMVGPAYTLRYIPAAIAGEVAAETREMTEDFVLERVRAGHGITGLYPPTDPASLDLFAAWRAKTGRTKTGRAKAGR